MRRNEDLPVPLGAVLEQKYRVERVIGHGGMGVVYEGTQLALDRVVAIKVMRPSLSADADAVARFDREARATSNLTSRHVTRILDVGRSNDGDPYFVMERLTGTTLQALLTKHGPMPPDQVVSVALDVIEALKEAHAAGIVHRDLKPANVVLCEAGPARIIDFGIARIADATGLTDTGTILGTAAYLAPEQLAGGDVGPAADVYTLGLVLIEALSGRRAFAGTAVESAAARLDHPPELPAGLDGAWSELLLPMTSLEPDRRPPAAEVAARLAGTQAATTPTPPTTGVGPDRLAGDTVAAPTGPGSETVTEPLGVTSVLPASMASNAGTTQRGRRATATGPWLGRHRWPLAGVAAIVLVALISIGVLASSRDDPPPSGGDDAVPSDLPDALDHLEEAVGR